MSRQVVERAFERGKFRVVQCEMRGRPVVLNLLARLQTYVRARVVILQGLKLGQGALPEIEALFQKGDCRGFVQVVFDKSLVRF